MKANSVSVKSQKRLTSKEEVYALDAVQTPMSLQEPVYNDGGDALYVMDQWVEELSLSCDGTASGMKERDG